MKQQTSSIKRQTSTYKTSNINHPTSHIHRQASSSQTSSINHEASSAEHEARTKKDQAASTKNVRRKASTMLTRHQTSNIYQQRQGSSRQHRTSDPQDTVSLTLYPPPHPHHNPASTSPRFNPPGETTHLCSSPCAFSSFCPVSSVIRCCSLEVSASRASFCHEAFIFIRAHIAAKKQK